MAMVHLAGAALPGVFLCFSAMVLLLFVSVPSLAFIHFVVDRSPGHQVSISEPTWHKVSFLNVRQANGTTHYGCFGYTNHDVGVGYYFRCVGLLAYPYRTMTHGECSNDRLNSTVLHNLTKTLILHPIGASSTFHFFDMAYSFPLFLSLWPSRHCVPVWHPRRSLPPRRNNPHGPHSQPRLPHLLRRMGHRHDSIRHRTTAV